MEQEKKDVKDCEKRALGKELSCRFHPKKRPFRHNIQPCHCVRIEETGIEKDRIVTKRREREETV